MVGSVQSTPNNKPEHSNSIVQFFKRVITFAWLPQKENPSKQPHVSENRTEAQYPKPPEDDTWERIRQSGKKALMRELEKGNKEVYEHHQRLEQAAQKVEESSGKQR